VTVPPLKRILIAFCWAISLLAALAAPASAASNWTLRQLPPTPLEGGGAAEPGLSGVSCPTESLCVAAGGFDTVASSQTPTAGAAGWHVVHPTYDEPKQSCLEKGESVAFCSSPRGSLNGVSCASVSLCVAVGYEGSVYVSTDPTGGANAWSVGEVNEAGGHGATHLTGVSCPSPSLCVAVSGGSNNSNGGKVLTSTEPAGDGAAWGEANAGGSVQITGVSCPTASRCAAVDNNGDVLTSTDPTGSAGAWQFENLVPFHPSAPEEEPRAPGNALYGASCASASLCALVGVDGRIFTATESFSMPPKPTSSKGHKAPRRPRTILVFAEHSWKVAVTRHRRIGARFRFYSPTQTRGFECKRDRGPYRPCHSPLRYRVTHGRHILRVRAIGPTGLRGPAAIKRFRVLAPVNQRR
jgi:hypothetical protein